MKPALTFAAIIVIVLLAIALLNPAESHPLLIDARTPDVPPCAAVPMCKPQGEIDCNRPNTRSFA